MIEKAKIQRLPIWVTLPNFPIHLWNEDVFAGVGSVLGKPIRMDAHTPSAINKEAARILVMMEADGGFPETVPIFMENDDGEETEEQILRWSTGSLHQGAQHAFHLGTGRRNAGNRSKKMIRYN